MKEKEKPQEVVAEYHRSTEHEGEKLDIILSVYDEAIEKSQALQIYTKFVILYKGAEWGHGLMAKALTREEALTAINEIAANPQIYKNA